jgi:hypothetical protein
VGDQSLPSDPLVSTGSPSDKGPYPRGTRPTFKVKGDTSSGWTPADDIPVVLPPATGTNSDAAQSAVDANGFHQFTFRDISILCNDIGLSPEMVEGVIAQLLVQHFSDASGIIYPELSNYIWTSDPVTRKIQILPVNKWEEVAAGKMPAVVYSDLGQTIQRLAIGDQFYVRPSEGYAEAFSRVCQGHHRLMCIGETDGSTGILASEVSRWFTEFAPMIVRSLPFLDFEVIQRDPPKAFNALGGRIGVALVLKYSYIWAWELAPAGPPLKALGALPSHLGT